MNISKINPTIRIKRFLDNGQTTEQKLAEYVEFSQDIPLEFVARYYKYKNTFYPHQPRWSWSEFVKKETLRYIVECIEHSIKKPVRLRKHKRQYIKAMKQDIVTRKWIQKQWEKEKIDTILNYRNKALELEEQFTQKVNDEWLSKHNCKELNMQSKSVNTRKRAIISKIKTILSYYPDWIHKHNKTIHRNKEKLYQEVTDTLLKLDRKKNNIKPYLKPDGRTLFDWDDFDLTSAELEIKYDPDKRKDYCERLRYVLTSRTDPYLRESPEDTTKLIRKQINLLKNPKKWLKPKNIDPKKSDYLRANWNSKTYWSGKDPQSKESLAGEDLEEK